jgi:hypothetical protein
VFLVIGNQLKISAREKNGLLFFALTRLGFGSLASIASFFVEKQVFHIQRQVTLFIAITTFLYQFKY